MSFETMNILSEDWNGMERCSDSWCAQQAVLLEKYLDGDMDTRGLIAMLQEMASKEQKKVQNDIANLMLHLLKIKYSTNEQLKNHWRGECVDFIMDVRDNFELDSKKKKMSNRDLVNNKAEEIIFNSFKKATDKYKLLSKEYSDLIDGLSKLPKESPWTLQDFLQIIDIDVFFQ